MEPDDMKALAPKGLSKPNDHLSWLQLPVPNYKLLFPTTSLEKAANITLPMPCPEAAVPATSVPRSTVGLPALQPGLSPNIKVATGAQSPAHHTGR